MYNKIIFDAPNIILFAQITLRPGVHKFLSHALGRKKNALTFLYLASLGHL